MLTAVPLISLGCHGDHEDEFEADEDGEEREFRSMYVSGKLPTYPSPSLALTLTSCVGQNVRFGEG